MENEIKFESFYTEIVLFLVFSATDDHGVLLYI